MAIPFWVYDDPARGLVLLRGDVRDLLDQAGVLHRARWSVSAKGWVLSAADGADLLAVAEIDHRPYRMKAVTG